MRELSLKMPRCVCVCVQCAVTSLTAPYCVSMGAIQITAAVTECDESELLVTLEAQGFAALVHYTKLVSLRQYENFSPMISLYIGVL